MNIQEREQLNQLLRQLVGFKLSAKDSEAEGLIQQAAAQQPDALYLLSQRVLLLEHALTNAKQQIEALQKQLQSAPAAASAGFLGADPWAQPAPVAPAVSNPVPGAGNYQPNRYAPPTAQAAPYAAAPAQAAPAGGGILGGGFLGNVAATAAGVAAGGFLFQGLENLMGHHGGGFGQGGGFGGSGFDQTGFGGEHVTENTVINNYYGDDAGQGQLADSSDFGGANFSNADYSDDSNSLFGGDGGDFGDDSSDSDWI